jgi:two-component system LytT family response regulator
MTVSTNPIRAVIVEDEPLGRALIRQMLGDDPDVNLVGECADGNEAVAVIQSREPDLVFLDVRIPERNGFDVLSALDLGRSTAVVFVTAHDEYAVRAFDVSAVDYLLKPFDRDRFQRGVRPRKVAYSRAAPAYGIPRTTGRKVPRLRLIVWLIIGQMIYFGYSRHHTRVR